MLIDLHQDIGTSQDSSFPTYKQTSLGQIKRSGINLVGTTTYLRTALTDGSCPKDEQVVSFYEGIMESEDRFVLNRNDVYGDGLGLLLVQEGFSRPEPHNWEQAKEKIERLFKAGVRVLIPVYHGKQGDSPMGTSSKDGIKVQVGLTKLGKSVCERWLDLGGILDASHASPPTFEDMVEICKHKNEPLIVSHTGSRKVVDETRCLSGKQLESLKELDDFLIGLGVSKVFLSQKGMFPGICYKLGLLISRYNLQLGNYILSKVRHPASLVDWKSSLSHFIWKVGSDHLALGSDLGGAISGLPQKYKNCEEIMPDMLELLKNNFAGLHEEIQFKNAERFLRENLPRDTKRTKPERL
ncbi:MAG: membrane dipeptidase [Candidatus Paceibacterota bacterium]